jgi:CheY-like chemotaxis protein
VLIQTASQVSIKAALAAGADSHLREPYRPLAILRVVKTLLTRRAGTE